MSNQISQPMTTNYLLQAFITEVITNRPEVQNGLTPRSRIIQTCKNTDYNDFVANGFKYMFLFDETLDIWLANNDEGNKQAKIISHDQIEFNYHTPLMSFNGAILTPGIIISDPTLYTKRSLQNCVNGPTLQEYITSFLGAFQEIQGQCPHDMETVGYFQPRFYLADYNILSISSNRNEDGTFTTSLKTSIIGVMKYKHAKTGVDRIMWLGTGLQQIVPNA